MAGTKPINTDHDFLSVSRITNLPDPTLAQHPATKAYVDSAVEGLAWKDSVRVAAPANVNLASPGATIDGVTMATNDRFLAGNQTTGSQNGIYIYNGAASPATRAPDMSTAAEVEQAVVTVEEGTSAGTTYRQTAVNVTLDTTTLTFTTFGTSAPAASETVAGIAELATQAEVNTGSDALRIVTPATLAAWTGKLGRYTQLFGDGSATSYTITHNLNSEEVSVTVYKVGGNKEEVDCEVRHTGVNSVTILVNVAPAASAYRVVVKL